MKKRFKGVIQSADASSGVQMTFYEIGGAAGSAFVVLAGDQLTVETVVMSIAAAGVSELYFDAAATPTAENVIIKHSGAVTDFVSMLWPPGHIVGARGLSIFGTAPLGEFNVTVTGSFERTGV